VAAALTVKFTRPAAGAGRAAATKIFVAMAATLTEKSGAWKNSSFCLE
jgi:hypothetical protein